MVCRGFPAAGRRHGAPFGRASPRGRLLGLVGRCLAAPLWFRSSFIMVSPEPSCRSRVQPEVHGVTRGFPVSEVHPPTAGQALPQQRVITSPSFRDEVPQLSAVQRFTCR